MIWLIIISLVCSLGALRADEREKELGNRKNMVKTVTFFKYPDSISPEDLEPSIDRALRGELRKVDLRKGVSYERKGRVGPDCRFEVTFSDGLKRSFYLIGRGGLISTDYKLFWEFPHGDIFLKSLGR
jgi:hypothetical protein